MHKIDGAGHVNGQFVNEDAATNRPPTEVTAEWLSAVQNELITVIESSGTALDKQNNGQLLAALKGGGLFDTQATGDSSRKVATTAFVHQLLAALPGDKFLQGLSSYNATTNVMKLAMSDGSTVDVDMTALVGDAIASHESEINPHSQYAPLNIIPVGSVIYTAQNSAPSGYLKANGAAISRTVYASLFAAIGATFGNGDGSTTFNLPDLRGEFVRGWDDGRGVDSGRALGAWQKGTLVVIDTPVAAIWGLSANVDGQSSQAVVGADNYDAANYSGASISATPASVTGVTLPGDSEGWSGVARPRNVALLACIKY